MRLEEYVDTHGIDVDELAVALLQRWQYVDDVRREDFRRALGDRPEKGAVSTKLLDLVSEADEQLRVSKQLRESLVDKQGNLIGGTVGEITKTLMTADRILESASKRYQTLYNLSSQQALEDAVKESMADTDPGIFQKFLWILNERLERIR